MTRFLGIELYEKTKLLKRGESVVLMITFDCNLDCSFCLIHLPGGSRAYMENEGISYWKHAVELLPVKVREFYISGGELTLPQFAWLPEFITWLLGKGYHVTLTTNLFDIAPILKIPKRYNFQISSTFHPEADLWDFDNKFWKLRNAGYRIEAKELGKKKLLTYSTLEPIRSKEMLYFDKRMLHLCSKNRIYVGEYEMSIACTPKEVK